MKVSQKAGMKSRFQREKLPQHRLGKMSDKKMVCGNSGQGAFSHIRTGERPLDVAEAGKKRGTDA
ncbi:MAG: hypothetical protein ACLQIB_01625 [Isosphaeraceae bacterium]